MLHRFQAGGIAIIFYAHSNKPDDQSDWEPLVAHLDRVADLAERYGGPLGIATAARLAGLLHDIGKYTAAFQARLSGAAMGVDHSTAGAKIALDLAGAADDRLVATLIACGGVDRNIGHVRQFVGLKSRPPCWGVDRNPTPTVS